MSYLSDYEKIVGKREVKADIVDLSRRRDISLVSRLWNLACEGAPIRQIYYSPSTILHSTAQKYYRCYQTLEAC